MAVKVCPAIVIVPFRGGPEFAAAANVTVPLPVPDAVPEIVSQSVLFDTAVHEQVLPAVIAIDPPPPAAGTIWLVGAMENEHGVSCVTVNA